MATKLISYVDKAINVAQYFAGELSYDKFAAKTNAIYNAKAKKEHFGKASDAPRRMPGVGGPSAFQLRSLVDERTKFALNMQQLVEKSIADAVVAILSNAEYMDGHREDNHLKLRATLSLLNDDWTTVQANIRGSFSGEGASAQSIVLVCQTYLIQTYGPIYWTMFGVPSHMDWEDATEDMRLQEDMNAAAAYAADMVANAMDVVPEKAVLAPGSLRSLTKAEQKKRDKMLEKMDVERPAPAKPLFPKMGNYPSQKAVPMEMDDEEDDEEEVDDMQMQVEVMQQAPLLTSTQVARIEKAARDGEVGKGQEQSVDNRGLGGAPMNVVRDEQQVGVDELVAVGTKRGLATYMSTLNSSDQYGRLHTVDQAAMNIVAMEADIDTKRRRMAGRFGPAPKRSGEEEYEYVEDKRRRIVVAPKRSIEEEYVQDKRRRVAGRYGPAPKRGAKQEPATSNKKTRGGALPFKVGRILKGEIRAGNNNPLIKQQIRSTVIRKPLV